jgi:hypothetical protein
MGEPATKLITSNLRFIRLRFCVKNRFPLGKRVELQFLITRYMFSAMSSRAAILLLGCFLVGLLFLVRFLSALFSPKIADQVCRHKIAHGVGACFAALSAYLMLAYINPAMWPPEWWERRTERQMVQERVNEAGGWEAVRRGCESIMSNHTNGFFWTPPSPGPVKVYPGGNSAPGSYYVTNLDYGPLPPAVAVLHPREIRYYPPRSLPQAEDVLPIGVLSIKFFGSHSTGGHDVPYLGLEMPSGPGADLYIPGKTMVEKYGPQPSYSKVAKRIFEIHY